MTRNDSHPPGAQRAPHVGTTDVESRSAALAPSDQRQSGRAGAAGAIVGTLSILGHGRSGRALQSSGGQDCPT
jgi:hypothetical protein